MHEKKIVIATHQMLYGASQALRDYLLKKKINELVYIGLPLVENKITSFHQFKKGKLVKSIEIKRRQVFGPLDYFTDAFFVFWWCIRLRGRYDVFIGVDPLNCIVGILLRLLGKTERVIFYSIDFVPVRFGNRLLNNIYHLLERLSVVFSNERWNVSPRIAEGRERFLKISEKKYRQNVVPIGIWNKKIKKTPFEKIKKHELLFVGHLIEKQGVQLVLDAIPQIIKKIPNFKFLIIGGGEYETKLKEKVKELDIQKYVKFQGWVKDRSKLEEMMSESACAAALYKPEEEKLYNFTYYADPTKLKDYLGAGLPIILTDVPYNAGQIQSKKCGIIVSYSKNEVARAVVDLMKDTEKLKNFRLNALEMAKEFEWTNIFDRAFGRL